MTTTRTTTSKTSSTQSGTSGSTSTTNAATETNTKISAIAPPTCISCKKMIVEDHYQKVFKPNGDAIPYHIKCLICVYCKTVIEDHYVWHGEELYHKQCSWQKMIADANKQQQPGKKK